MNKDMLKKMDKKRVRLRPRVTRVVPKCFINGRPSGSRAEEVDHIWMVEPCEAKDTVRLRNLSTDHVLDLGMDHIREFRTDPEPDSDGFLLLKSRLRVTREGRLEVEPAEVRW